MRLSIGQGTDSILSEASYKETLFDNGTLGSDILFDFVDIEGGVLKLYISHFEGSDFQPDDYLDGNPDYIKSNCLVDLGYILGDSSDRPDVTGGIIDWGDDSNRTTFTTGEGYGNSKFTHFYNFETKNEYVITIKGKIRWGHFWTRLESTTRTKGNLTIYLTKIEIPSAAVSAIYDIPDSGAFYDNLRLVSIPSNLLENCGHITSAVNIFDSCASLKTIPENIFAPLVNVTTFECAFGYCSSISSIPSKLFSTNIKAKSFESTFRTMSGFYLKNIPEDLFKNCPIAEDFTETFRGQTLLTSIPQNLFANLQCKKFERCFYDCGRISTDVPTLWLSYPEATGTDCFKECTNATNYNEIPEDWGGPEMKNVMELLIETTSDNYIVDLGYCLGGTSSNPEVTRGSIDWGDGSGTTAFANGDSNTDSKFQHPYTAKGEHTITISGKIVWHKRGQSSLATNDIRKVLKSITIPEGKTSPIYDIGINAFYRASELTSIPAGLFENCTQVTNFGECFYYCSSLLSIPSKLFDNCTKATNFDTCFQYCTKLTAIPEGLFDQCTQVTNFHNCFGSCTSLKSIPSGLFNNCTNVTNFYNCFSSCTSLKSIPPNLFDNCAKVTNFGTCFTYCTNLQSVPSGLFDNGIKVINFQNCFDHCTSLTSIPSGLFDYCIQVTNFNSCFKSCSSITSEVPRLWETHSTATGTDCFKGCNQAQNWADVPEAWGGGYT